MEGAIFYVEKAQSLLYLIYWLKIEIICFLLENTQVLFMHMLFVVHFISKGKYVNVKSRRKYVKNIEI